jgi:hypothetical protein
MESPQRDPTTPRGRACPRVRVCACLGRRDAPSWADRQEDREAGRQGGRKTGRTGRQGGQPDTPSRTGRTQASPDLASLALPCSTLPRFPPFPRVSYCQRKRHTRTPQNGLLSSHFTIFQSIKTLLTDTQQLARQLNIISII